MQDNGPIEDRLLHRPCSALEPGHRHCRHGHTADCPDPDNCELLDRPVHPYFINKAGAAFAAASGDPDNSAALAAWAQAAHDDPDMTTRDQVIVAADGTILGQARYVRDRVGAAYVRTVTHDRDRDLIGREVGLAVGSLARSHGARAIVVTYSQVCLGQGGGRS